MTRRIFVAITGTKHYFGTSFLKPGMLIHLKKESDNPHDQEAIMAVVTPIGKIGYVANSHVYGAERLQKCGQNL